MPMINVKQEIKVPNGIYCGNCIRKEANVQQPYCTIFWENLFWINDKCNIPQYLVKCHECWDAMYEALQNGK